MIGSSSCNQSAARADADDKAASPAQVDLTAEEPELRVLDEEELTPDIIDAAQRILAEHKDDPLGTEVPFELEGRRYVGRLEEHYHPPGSDEGPIGEHVGVTVYTSE